MDENHFNKSVMLPKQMVYKKNLGFACNWNVGNVEFSKHFSTAARTSLVVNSKYKTRRYNGKHTGYCYPADSY